MTAVRKVKVASLWEMDSKCSSDKWTVMSAVRKIQYYERTRQAKRVLITNFPTQSAVTARPGSTWMPLPHPMWMPRCRAPVGETIPPTAVRWTAPKSPNQSARVQTKEAESCKKTSPLTLSMSTLCLSSPSPFSLACARVLFPHLGVWEISLGHVVCTIVDSALDNFSASAWTRPEYSGSPISPAIRCEAPSGARGGGGGLARRFTAIAHQPVSPDQVSSISPVSR